MKFYVVIKYGWSCNTFYYATEDAAMNIYNSVKNWKDVEAHIYIRSGDSWDLYR